MQPGRRQKLPEEYSTNPNTVRARKRKARLSPLSKEVEQAKASDAKALTRAWKQRVDTDTYKMASDEERKSILASCEEEVMSRRKNKGLDSDSKINRFMARMEEEAEGRSPRSTSTAGAPAASIGPIGPMDPALTGHMQPMAAMGPPMSQVSRGYGAPYSPYHVLPSIEGRMEAESPFSFQSHMFHTPPKHGHYHQPMHPSSLGQHSRFNHIHPQQSDDEAKYHPSALNVVPDMFHKTQMPRDMDEAVQKITTLEKRIKKLEADLAVAQTTIAALGERMEKTDSRMQKHDTTIESVADAGRNFQAQTSLLERVVQGVQRIADVAAEVAHIMRSEGLDSANRPPGAGNDIEDDDSGISPDGMTA